MSSSSRLIASAALAVMLLSLLAGCTGLRPIYSDAALGPTGMHVAFSPPGNRLEQIIYNDLALKLGTGRDNAPMVSVSAKSSAADLVSDTVKTPVSARQVTVSALLIVTAPDGTVLFSGTRSQTADLTHGAQALANQQATAAAQRQAALLLAETLRLEIVGALDKWQH